MHHSYFDPNAGVLDLSVLKSQAYKRSIDKLNPEATVIHMHKYGIQCGGIDHFQYDVKEVLDGEDQSTPTA